jgi:hypothetical protein
MFLIRGVLWSEFGRKGVPKIGGQNSSGDFPGIFPREVREIFFSFDVRPFSSPLQNMPLINLIRDGVDCEFIPQALVAGELCAIFAGLYAPAKSNPLFQFLNNTSYALRGPCPGSKYNWCDLFAKKPPEGAKCEDVDLDLLDQFITDRSPEAEVLVRDYFRRIMILVAGQRANGNKNPVIIWLGVIVNKALQWMYELGLMQRESEFQTPWARVVMTTDGISSIEDAVHPTAHLICRSPEAIELFKLTFVMLETMRQICCMSFEQLLEAMGDSVRERVQHLIRAFDAAGIPHTNCWLDHDLRHVRLMSWTEQKVQQMLALKAALGGQDGFIRLLSNTSAVSLDQEGFCAASIEMIGVLGPPGFLTFLSGQGVAGLLCDKAFKAQVRELASAQMFGPAGCVTIMSGSNNVASRLCEAAFMA